MLQDVHGGLIHLVGSLHLLLFVHAEVMYAEQRISCAQRPGASASRERPFTRAAASSTRQAHVDPIARLERIPSQQDVHCCRVAKIQKDKRSSRLETAGRLIQGDCMPAKIDGCGRQYGGACTHFYELASLAGRIDVSGVA